MDRFKKLLNKVVGGTGRTEYSKQPTWFDWARSAKVSEAKSVLRVFVYKVEPVKQVRLLGGSRKRVKYGRSRQFQKRKSLSGAEVCPAGSLPSVCREELVLLGSKLDAEKRAT